MRIGNKQAPVSFNVEQKYEAGIVLLGQEVKAVKLGHADLTGSYVKIIGSEAYLVNARVYPYEYARTAGYDEKRTRKLLLHKKELLSLKSKLSLGKHTLVGISLYDKGGLIKAEIGLSKGKKKGEHEKDLRRRVLDRDQAREFKEEKF